MCKLKDELIKRQDQHEEPEEYFECECGQEITKQQNAMCKLKDELIKNNMKIDFNEFLSEKHFEENPQILDDYLSDAFEDWLTNLDPQEFIDYGQEYAELINKKPCDIENSYASEDDYLQSCGRL